MEIAAEKLRGWVEACRYGPRTVRGSHANLRRLTPMSIKSTAPLFDPQPFEIPEQVSKRSRPVS